MDHGEKSMMVYDKKYTEIKNNEIKLLNIDHHISNDGFGDVNLVDVNATSSTIVVYRLIKSLGLKVTPDIATALLGGIYTDTTSFFNLNTNYESLKVSSELLSYGANRKSVVKSLFQNHTIPQLKLWGRLLTKLHVNEKGFLVSYVTDKDFEKTNTTPEQVIGAIDLMNTVAGVKLSLLMNEDREG
jgi:bifunctional oligoribonuclease and PAP phosphatase NrnA